MFGLKIKTKAEKSRRNHLNHQTRIRLAILLLISLMVPSCAELGIYWPGPQSPGGPRAGGEPQVSVSNGISAGEARGMAVGHGLTGMRGLPPGIQRNLLRGKPLPPGIARHMVPRRMLGGLPEIPDHEWRVAGRDLILIAIGTLIVVEILEDVFN